MENNSILLEGLGDAINIAFHHLVVGGLAAIILILVAIFKKRLMKCSSGFAPVRLHEHWSTTLTELTAETLSGSVQTKENPEGRKVHEYVNLHQFFNWVWGETYVQNEARDVYKVKGQLVATNLALIFRDKNGFNTGAIFLRVTSKDLMQGYEVGVDREGKLYSRVYTWKREVDKFAVPSSGH